MPALSSTAHAAPPPAPDELNQLEKDFRLASGLLYAQTDDGGFRMMCTVTAFEKKDKKYHFVTAAHCVSDDDTQHERVDVAKTNWFITFDEPGNKSLIEAKVIGVGYQHRGDDFAVLEVDLAKDVPTMPLAANDPQLGENISNFASPLGLGKQLFRGHVSMEKLDRPVIEDSINWKGATLVQMSSGPGSSGSAIVSQHQKGIVAFLVGVIGARGSQNIVTIPVGRFKKFWTEVQAGTYKWYKTDTESLAASASGTAKVKKLWSHIHTQGIVYHIEGDEPAAQ
ncbi:MAG TPA: trypsin-like peptidase domain-containing protein [Candidatus Eisenbacteria bacterium]|nr:trypsin-like peptidase domain-containing protein [Candidatus Eisenbacteria bacterium]